MAEVILWPPVVEEGPMPWTTCKLKDEVACNGVGLGKAFVLQLDKPTKTKTIAKDMSFLFKLSLFHI